MQTLRDSENNMFDCVCVKDFSRFARNTGDFLLGIRTLKCNGVDVRFLSANQTVIGESEFILTVFAALAQEESSNLSKRVIFGKQQNAKKGRVPNVIYGYDKIDTFTLSINPAEGNTVKLIYKWYIDGDGCRHIAARLNDMHIATKHGAKWTSKTVKRILTNPIYSGILVNNKTVTKDFISGTRIELPSTEWLYHERPELQLVSSVDFDLVASKLAERRDRYKNENPGNRYSSKHVFSNLIKCSECGGAFTSRIYKWKNTYVRYRCATHNNHGNAHCSNNVTIDEQALLREIKQYLLSAIEDSEAFFKKLNEKHAQTSDNIDISLLNKSRNSLLARRNRLKELYVEGMIDINELKKEFQNIDNSISSLDAELADLLKTPAEPDDNTDFASNIGQLLLNCQFSNEDMRSVVEQITVSPDGEAEVCMK